MANEITTTLNVITENGYSERFVQSASITQNTQLMHNEIVAVTTSAATVSMGGVTTKGVAIFYNLGANNISIGPDSTGLVPFITLKPAEFAYLRLDNATTVKAQASTATTKMQIIVFND